MTEVRCILDGKAELGECPVWSAEERTLYWVDILAPALHRLASATGATRTWKLPQSIGSFGLREAGGAVLKTIFITSLSHDLPANKLAAKPLSGGIFAIEVEVPGVPVAKFKG